MKRGIFVLVLILFMFSLVVAQETNSQENNLGEQQNPEKLRENSNEFLEKEISLPAEFQFIAKFLFGLDKEEKISFQLFIILIAAWIFLYLGLVSIVRIIPFFDGAKSWFATLAIMLLIGISNGLQLAGNFLISLSSFFGLLKGWEIVGLAISLVILVVIYFFLQKFGKFMKNKLNIEENQIVGQNIKVASEMGKIQRENL